MFRFEVHKIIQRIISFFYLTGLWHRGDQERVGERRLKWFYLIYYSFAPISLVTGAYGNENRDEKMFAIEVAIMTTVGLVKLWYIVWRKSEILDLLNRICDYRIEDREIFTDINAKLTKFMKIVSVILCYTYFCQATISLVLPFVGASERKLFFAIGFPLDWRNNQFAYWMANLYIFTQVVLTAITLLFTVIVWYLMANCSWRYDVLGQQMVKMGEIQAPVDESGNELQISNTQRDNLYLRYLVGAITSRNDLKELTNQLDSVMFEMFMVQLSTSALCICLSTYSLAFIRSENLLEPLIYLFGLLYNFFDIFMIMYFGNEIKLKSDRLSWHLYESNWVDRSLSIKKIVLIFGEFLMQPEELIIFKIYPLTLETFGRILNSAYSMFNILQNFQ